MTELRHNCEKGAKEVRHVSRQENDAVAFADATYVKLTSIRTFPGVEPTKEQALKPLEEAAEVVEAFKRYDSACTDVIRPSEAAPFMRAGFKSSLMDEIADTIQASCNLAAALGVTDLTPYLARCEERNRERGRYDR